MHPRRTPPRMVVRLADAAEKAADWHDRRLARQRDKFLRRGRLITIMLVIALGNLGLTAFTALSDPLRGNAHVVIGFAALLALTVALLKFWHMGEVTKAKRRGEI